MGLKLKLEVSQNECLKDIFNRAKEMITISKDEETIVKIYYYDFVFLIVDTHSTLENFYKAYEKEMELMDILGMTMIGLEKE